VGRGHGLAGAPEGLHYLSLYGDSLALPTPEAAARAREGRSAAHGGLGAWLEAAAVWGRRWGIENRLTLRGATGLERLALRARRVRAQAVGIDSLTLGAMGAALSDPTGWNRLLAALEGLGVPLIVLDHLGKDGDAGAVGSFLKEARFRSVLTLRREAPGVLRVEHTKANFGPAVPSFRVRDVHGTDDAGRPVVTFTRAAEGAGDGPRPGSPASPESPHDPTPRGAPLRPRRPVPRPLPAPRPALRVLPPAGAQGPQGLQGPPESPPAHGERRVHQRIDAEVLAAVRAGTPADRAALAAALPYAEKTCANSLSRLRKAGILPRPDVAPMANVGATGATAGGAAGGVTG
jgi:hypothetical protein